MAVMISLTCVLSDERARFDRIWITLNGWPSGQAGFVRRLEGETMKLVKQLLDSKGHDVLSIAPGASVLEAIRLMAEKGIGAPWNRGIVDRDG